jgi:hypothetical protein
MNAVINSDVHKTGGISASDFNLVHLQRNAVMKKDG